MDRVTNELDAIEDPAERRKKYKEFKKKGMIGAVPRVILGQTTSKQNGLFLFDKEGNPRAKFVVDKDNQVKLVAFDEKGNIVSTWPKKN